MRRIDGVLVANSNLSAKKLAQDTLLLHFSGLIHYIPFTPH